LLRDSSLNKSTAFTEAEKQVLGLVGLAPDGLQQDFEATLGDSGCVSICNDPSVFDTSKRRGFDFHMFTWDK